MNPLYAEGDELRVIRNIRNDGSFPGRDKGELLIRRGSTGFVTNIGTFLQDQIIYTLHFMDLGLQVGCREEELIPVSEPWVETRFESREKVCARISLALAGEVVVEAGAEGEIIKVNRNEPGIIYHVLFPGSQLLAVPESALQALTETEKESA